MFRVNDESGPYNLLVAEGEDIGHYVEDILGGNVVTSITYDEYGVPTGAYVGEEYANFDAYWSSSQFVVPDVSLGF